MKPKLRPGNHYTDEERHRAMWLFGSAAVFVVIVTLVTLLVKLNE